MIFLIDFKTCLFAKNPEITGGMLAICHLEINEISAIIAPKTSYGPIKTSNGCKYFDRQPFVITKNTCDCRKTSKANPIETTLHQAA